MQIAITTDNAATAFVMVFHFLEFMAELAVKMSMPLLAFSLLAVIFGPRGRWGRPAVFHIDYDCAFLRRPLPGASGDGIPAQDPNTAKTLNEKLKNT
jgi:hypothetical protein